MCILLNHANHVYPRAPDMQDERLLGGAVGRRAKLEGVVYDFFMQASVPCVCVWVQLRMPVGVPSVRLHAGTGHAFLMPTSVLSFLVRAAAPSFRHASRPAHAGKCGSRLAQLVPFFRKPLLV